MTREIIFVENTRGNICNEKATVCSRSSRPSTIQKKKRDENAQKMLLQL